MTVEWHACWRLPSPKFAERQLLGADSTEPIADQIREYLESHVLRFWRSVETIQIAQDRLRERIDALLKAEVGKMSLEQFVNLNSEHIRLDELNGRLRDEIRKTAIEEFGIEVVDVRIKRFNHPMDVKPAIFDMIRTERRGVAERYRAEGKSAATWIRSEADKRRAQILSKAYADSERIRGEGDAEAMRIANAAHSKDPQFYQLLKTLDTYRSILNERTTVVLSADSNLLRLLTAGMPNLPGTTGPGTQAGGAEQQRRRLASDGSAGEEQDP